MVHENEYLSKEFVDKINDDCKLVNELLGREAVVMKNTKGDLNGCVDIWFDGEHVYQPAEDIEAEAYLEGMLQVLKRI